MAVRHALGPGCIAGRLFLSPLTMLMLSIGMIHGADSAAAGVDDKLIMADYAGINPQRTIEARRQNLDKLAHSVVLKICIREWPLKITVLDPTDAEGISGLRDGDRGFAWEMT